MSEIRRKTEENIEDVERISNILNRRIKKINNKLGAPGKDKKNKNPLVGKFDKINNRYIINTNK
ncbi:hypothetical protein ES703_107306 [subsurface metagenome]